MNRREFLQGAAALGASGLINAEAQQRPVAPSDRVNLGIIGPGSRGQQLMRAFSRVPGVRFVALCDVYEPRFAQARKITGEQTPAFGDYRQLLDQKDIDAVVVSTPLSFHAEHEVAALSSGRPVYGEKSLGLTVEHCNQIRDAVQRSGKHFQIGAQFQYAPWYREAFRRIHDGKIGKVLQIYAYWHRNNNWRRPVPGNDPKLERLINWRMYREYSGGLPAELGSHHITAANTIFNSVPEWVIGSGGIDFWKDGREVPDNVQLTYRYPGGETLFFSALTTNAIEGCQLRIYGTGGSIVLTQADATVYYEPKTSANSAVPEAVVMEHGIVTGASYRAEMPYRGPGEKIEIPENEQGNAEYLAVKSFIECIRNNQKPAADIEAGFGSGVAVAIGNEAIDKGTRVVFADRVKQAQSAKAGA